MLIQSKATGQVYDASLDLASTIEVFGVRWFVARAGDGCFLVNRLDPTAYIIIGVSEEEQRQLSAVGCRVNGVKKAGAADEERQLAAAGYGIERKEAAADAA